MRCKYTPRILPFPGIRSLKTWGVEKFGVDLGAAVGARAVLELDAAGTFATLMEPDGF